MLVRTQNHDLTEKSKHIRTIVALHFRENATPQQAKSMAYVTSTPANCRRWVKRHWSVSVFRPDLNSKTRLCVCKVLILLRAVDGILKM
jgi:hypothetical protein